MDVASPNDIARPAPLPLEVEEYLMWLDVERGRAARTIEAYRRDLRGYIAWLDEQNLAVASVGEADLVRWLAEKTASDSATSSVARALVPDGRTRERCGRRGCRPHSR